MLPRYKRSNLLAPQRRTVKRFETLVTRLTTLKGLERDEYFTQIKEATRNLLTFHQEDLAIFEKVTKELLFSEGYGDDPDGVLEVENWMKMMAVWSHPKCMLEGSRVVPEWVELTSHDMIQLMWGI